MSIGIALCLAQQHRLASTKRHSTLLRSIHFGIKYRNGRMTLDNVNASYDTSTGNLTGTIIVNMFSMTGTDNSYSEPDAGDVAYGTDNIFGTIESGKKSKKSKKNKTKAAETNTEQAASDTGADGQTTDSQEGANTQDAAAAETTGQAQ